MVTDLFFLSELHSVSGILEGVSAERENGDIERDKIIDLVNVRFLFVGNKHLFQS